MTERPGIAASSGVAIGPLFVYRPPEYQVARETINDTDAEMKRLAGAVLSVQADIRETIDRLCKHGNDDEAAIFEIQLEFLEDPTFGGEIQTRVRRDGVCAEAVVEDVTAGLVEEFSTIKDRYFSQRSADIADLGRRLVWTLLGINDRGFADLNEPSIIVARDLTPSDTASLPSELVLGLGTEIGSTTSHTAILSRGLGIPSVVGLGAGELRSGVTAILDAIDGRLILDPDANTLETFRDRKREQDTLHAQHVARARKPAITTDGVNVEVVANIGSIADARESLEMGAEGAGLLRTEFLFLDRADLPDEDEQYETYRGIAEVYGDRPLVVRTMDIGGDKPLPALPLPREENPFLGRRAIRLALDEPEKLLYPQLRALMRAAVHGNIKIMFPMVSLSSEVTRLRDEMRACAAQLSAADVPHRADMEVGIMIEVPAAALAARHIAPHVDFFSIGTNDLAQYTLAVDRTNESVAAISDYCEPAVLELIRRVIDAAHDRGIWAGMCGEMAGDPLVAPLLLGLGLDEYSMSAASIPLAKHRMRGISQEQSRAVAERCLDAPDAASVRRILEAV